MKSVFVVSPGCDEDIKWGIWVAEKPVRTISEALDHYSIDEECEEVDSYSGKSKQRAMVLAKKWVKRVHARKRIVII